MDGWTVELFLIYSPVDNVNISLGLGYSDRDSWLIWQSGRDLSTLRTDQWSPRIGVGVFFTSRQQLQLDLQWIGLKARERERFVISERGSLDRVARAPDTQASQFAISDLVLQLRYRWQIAPLSDLFVVYNRGGGSAGASPSDSFSSLLSDAFKNPQREALIVKLRYRFGLSKGSRMPDL